MGRWFCCLCVVAATALQCGCDLADLAGLSSGQLEERSAKAIRPFFPHAVVRLDDRSEQLLVVTCTEGIGEQLLREIAPRVLDMPDVRALRSVRRSKWRSMALQAAGIELPRFLTLDFGESALKLDTQRDTYELQSSPAPNRFARYAAGCGPQLLENAVAWLGIFRTTYIDSAGNRHTTTAPETLGVYPGEMEFAAQKNDEIAARQSLIQQRVERGGGRVVSIELQAINRVQLASKE